MNTDTDLRMMSNHDLYKLAHDNSQPDADRRMAADRLFQQRLDGRTIVLNTLASLGYAIKVPDRIGYDMPADHGWHILPAVTPWHTLGFVNITQGIAVETDVELSPTDIDALTIPGDPDPRPPAQMPQGWRYLAVNVQYERFPAVTLDPRYVRAHVVTWGLMTVYGHRGTPGWANLNPTPASRPLPAAEWPDTGDLDGMRKVATSALEEAASAFLTRHVPQVTDLLPDFQAAHQHIKQLRAARTQGHTVFTPGHFHAEQLARDAFVDARLNELADLAGKTGKAARDAFLIGLQWRLEEHIHPIVRALVDEPLRPDHDEMSWDAYVRDASWQWQRLKELVDQLYDHVMPPIATRMLTHTPSYPGPTPEERAETGINAAHETYLHAGPVETRLKHQNPPRPTAMTPEDLRTRRTNLGLNVLQLAELLGMSPETVAEMEEGKRVIDFSFATRLGRAEADLRQRTADLVEQLTTEATEITVGEDLVARLAAARAIDHAQRVGFEVTARATSSKATRRTRRRSTT